MKPMRRSILVVVVLLLGQAAEASARVYQDRLLSGGAPAASAQTAVIWAAVGDPLGGKMSGGGYRVAAGGGMLGNLPPRIKTFIPATKSRFYRGDSVSLKVTATDPEKDSLSFRFLVDGTVLKTWSSESSATWNTSGASFGWHIVRVEVKDKSHTVARESRVFVFWRPPSP